ncbi:MAG: LptF/LptG family permease [Candidatus Omnitrophica bacterium]|nr:LptF/LptG family permease [Candidatus Omnitrophota bacterium]
MKILRYHVLKEFFGLFLSCLGILLFIFLVGRGFVQMADLIFNKDVDVVLVLKLLVLSLPFLLVFVIPMATLMASLLAFGRLSSDNEIMAMRASGIGLFKVLSPLFLAVAVLSLVSLLLSDRIASTTHYAHRLLLMRLGIENPSAALEEGTFIKKFKDFVIFIYEIDKNRLKGIRIYQPQEGRATRTIVAEKGEILSFPEKNMLKLKLRNGTSDEPNPKDPSQFYKLNFKTYELPLNLSKTKVSQAPEKKPKDMTIQELQNEIERLGEAGIQATYPLSAEIHHKIAMSLSSLAFLLIGVPLAVKTRRSEKSIGFGMSLALMALYWTLLVGGKALAQKGLAPPFLSLQFCNLAVGGMGIFFLSKLERS